MESSNVIINLIRNIYFFFSGPSVELKYRLRLQLKKSFRLRDKLILVQRKLDREDKMDEYFIKLKSNINKTISVTELNIKYLEDTLNVKEETFEEKMFEVNLAVDELFKKIR